MPSLKQGRGCYQPSRPLVGNVTWDEPFNKENAFSGNASDSCSRHKYDCRNYRHRESSVQRYGDVRCLCTGQIDELEPCDFSAGSQITQPVQEFTGKIEGATRDTGTHITAQTDWLKEVFAILFVAILLFVLLVSVVLSR